MYIFLKKCSFQELSDHEDILRSTIISKFKDGQSAQELINAVLLTLTFRLLFSSLQGKESQRNSTEATEERRNEADMSFLLHLNERTMNEANIPSRIENISPTYTSYMIRSLKYWLKFICFKKRRGGLIRHTKVNSVYSGQPLKRLKHLTVKAVIKYDRMVELRLFVLSINRDTLQLNSISIN